jgi:ketosteroid isomerase-like protein
MDETATARQAIIEWHRAIVDRDLDGVLAAHTDDIVMFDVPPPERGARGLADYAATWPPFFDWLSSGTTFEIDKLEVVSGEYVAFAWALLRCGDADELRRRPDRRLRLTLGLRRLETGWVIDHEHHSFTRP